MKYFICLILFPLSLFASIKVAIIGDSISLGAGVNPGQSYVDLLEARYASEGKDIQIINRSFGYATSSTLDQITVSILTEDMPDYIVTFIGVNDARFNTPQSTLITNFSNAFFKGSTNVKKVILGGVDASLLNSPYNNVLFNLYVTLINSYPIYPALFYGSDIFAHLIDGVHPDAIGHQLIAQHVYDALHAVGAY